MCFTGGSVRRFMKLLCSCSRNCVCALVVLVVLPVRSLRRHSTCNTASYICIELKSLRPNPPNLIVADWRKIRSCDSRGEGGTDGIHVSQRSTTRLYYDTFVRARIPSKNTATDVRRTYSFKDAAFYQTELWNCTEKSY